MDSIKNIRTYRFTFKRFFIAKEFDIRAFSLPCAIEKFHAIFPKHKILLIEEVENEPK